MKKWTVSQNEAINQRDKDLLVSASAGSGKTTVMIERIASMLQNGTATTSDILVLTFTNASAADMKIKLHRRLGGSIDPSVLDSAFIGTFHKFCGELVRTYFNIAEVSPDFEILDESTASLIKNEILNNIIIQNYDRLRLVIDTFCTGRKTDLLKEMLLSIYNFLMSRDNPQQWLSDVAYKSYDSDFAMKKIVEYYRMVGTYYKQKFSEFEVTDRMTPYIVQCLDISGRVADVSCYDDLNKIAQTVEYTRLNASAGKDFADYGNFKDLRDRLKKITDKIKDHYAVSCAQMQKNQEMDRKIVEGVVDLVSVFMREYSAEKLRQNKLDFNDLEKYACIVLDNTEVVKTVKQKYKYIFVDEYQDTNPMQEKVLSQVASERNIFMVGDVKQSIYGFRGCEATIFAGRMTDYQANLSGLVVKLNENFRSSPKILQFTNLVFGKIMRECVADIDYNQTSRFAINDSNVELSKGCNIDVTLLNTTKGTAPRKQAAVISNKIAELLNNGVALSDIAILSRSRTNLGELANVLRAAGISVSVDADVIASELFEINLLENMLYACTNFYNDVPLVMLMSSFVFDFSADELAEIKLQSEKEEPFYKAMMRIGGEKMKRLVEFLNRYRELSKQMTVVDLITVFLTEFKIIERLLILPQGDNMVANIYSYLDVLRGGSWAVSVSGYLYLLENQLIEVKIKQNGKKRDSVQIMTMHASKGLEFPVVFVYDVGANFNVSDSRRLMVIDKSCGLCVYSLDADEFQKTHSIARHSAVIALNNVTIAEEMRLLYVTLTRAKQKMFIVGGGNIDVLNKGNDDYDILSAKNHLQFLAPSLFGGESDCFNMQVIDAEDVVVEERAQSIKVLSGRHDERLTQQLKEVYNKPYQYQAAVTTRAKTSVSELLRGEERKWSEIVARGAQQFQSTSGKGKDFGTAYHKQMQWMSIEEIEKIIPIVNGAKMYRELAFLQTVGDSIVQGVIDLVAIKGDCAFVIDYKTTNATHARLVELYSRQLQMYASAVRDALPNIKEIKCFIYSLVHEKLIEIGV